MIKNSLNVMALPNWNGYQVQILGYGDDCKFQVLNKQHEPVNVVWATIEGATACAELLAEGYLSTSTSPSFIN